MFTPRSAARSNACAASSSRARSEEGDDRSTSKPSTCARGRAFLMPHAPTCGANLAPMISNSRANILKLAEKESKMSKSDTTSSSPPDAEAGGIAYTCAPARKLAAATRSDPNVLSQVYSSTLARCWRARVVTARGMDCIDTSTTWLASHLALPRPSLWVSSPATTLEASCNASLRSRNTPGSAANRRISLTYIRGLARMRAPSCLSPTPVSQSASFSCALRLHSSSAHGCSAVCTFRSALATPATGDATRFTSTRISRCTVSGRDKNALCRAAMAAPSPTAASVPVVELTASVSESTNCRARPCSSSSSTGNMLDASLTASTSTLISAPNTFNVARYRPSVRSPPSRCAATGMTSRTMTLANAFTPPWFATARAASAAALDTRVEARDTTGRNAAASPPAFSSSRVASISSRTPPPDTKPPARTSATSMYASAACSKFSSSTASSPPSPIPSTAPTLGTDSAADADGAASCATAIASSSHTVRSNPASVKSASSAPGRPSALAMWTKRVFPCCATAEADSATHVHGFHRPCGSLGCALGCITVAREASMLCAPRSGMANGPQAVADGDDHTSASSTRLTTSSTTAQARVAASAQASVTAPGSASLPALHAVRSASNAAGNASPASASRFGLDLTRATSRRTSSRYLR
mmetsp:Transcript_21100/g.68042  ORF Transcript_21100/g.68042 Transcript_21100/m.68042 type:complete len:648 (-) Transcript_21100:1029-2972(-)